MTSKYKKTHNAESNHSGPWHVSSDLWPYVLDTRMKRAGELSTDHHLLFSWISWWWRMLDGPGGPKRIVRVHWEHLSESPVHKILNCHFSNFLHRKLKEEAGERVVWASLLRLLPVWPGTGWVEENRLIVWIDGIINLTDSLENTL